MAVEKNEVDEVFKAILYAEDPQEFKKKVEHISKEVFSERRKEDGTTPLMLAVSEDREDLFDVLIELGVDPKILSDDRIFEIPPVTLSLVGGRNLLHFAFWKGASLSLKEKIAHLFPEFVEEKDWNGLLPRELSLNIVDEVVPVKRRMLRKKEIQKYFVEHFKMKINEFFVLPKELEVLGPGLSCYEFLSSEKVDLFRDFLMARRTEKHPPNTMNRYGFPLEGTPGYDVISTLMVDYVPTLMKMHIKASCTTNFSGAQKASDSRENPQLEGSSFLEQFQTRLDPDHEFLSHYSFVIQYFGKQEDEGEGKGEEKKENDKENHQKEGEEKCGVSSSSTSSSCQQQDESSSSSGRDRLNFHKDKSYFTINICLDLPEEEHGSVLYFDYKGDQASDDFKNCKNLLSVRHRKGWAVIHEGMMNHGASPITREERTNLVIWGR